MSSISHRVTVAGTQNSDVVTVHLTTGLTVGADDYAEIMLSHGGTLRTSPACMDLLHEALCEIFGKDSR